ncbi:hypothetical protein SteCoe_13177 [Stentor coeruleus]|uniref:Uncharacterized protein n=1 Tax=Stentor coeruleus TaxID=5963 RepID=A0A1R2C927_9CILI|nr:hypothetical protein SteCoe_13177 [Stentor coeruleus]
MDSAKHHDSYNEEKSAVKFPIITHKAQEFSLEKNTRNPRGSQSTIRSSGISIQKAPMSTMKNIAPNLEQRIITESSRTNSLCLKSIQRHTNNLSALADYEKDSKNKSHLKNPKKILNDFSNNVSEGSPDWFKIPISPILSDISDNSEITILSKLNGWIYVSGKSKNRKNRYGKFSPFDKNEFNVHNVSNLAPDWMHRAQCITPTNQNIKIIPQVSNIKENNRNTIFENNSPTMEKIINSEMRENIVRDDNKKQISINYRPRMLYEWKEPLDKNNEKFVTGKIGQI